jgi:glutathione synthase/RimK-type ligase-like ATP-grasp enzyme
VSRVALATSRFALPGAPGARGALEANEDLDLPGVCAALESLGVEGRAEVWDDHDVDWESYDLVVVRSTWGYVRSYASFLSWAHARARLVNPYTVIEYSSDKHYLADLRDRGVPIIDSEFCEVGDTPLFPEGDFVVKPTIGAGSIDARRFAPTQHAAAREHVAALHATQRCALIQPYVASIDERGEVALIFFDAEFSHAVTKRAMLNVAPHERDGAFRASQIVATRAEPGAVELARDILSGSLGDLAYARVDLVRAGEGFELMELELVEPALYLTHGEGSTERFARAIARRLP